MQGNFEAAVESAINEKKSEGWLSMVLVLICIVPLLAFRGWVITEYWTWFVTPTFTTLPSLTVVPAIGIAGLITFLTMNPLATTVKHSTPMTVWIGFFMTAWFWVSGWIISLFL